MKRKTSQTKHPQKQNIFNAATEPKVALVFVVCSVCSIGLHSIRPQTHYELFKTVHKGADIRAW